MTGADDDPMTVRLIWQYIEPSPRGEARVLRSRSLKVFARTTGTLPCPSHPCANVEVLVTTDSVWIRGQNDVLARADTIILLARVHDSLIAECLGGHAVQLTGSKCSLALQLALLEAIRRAGACDRRAMVIMPPADEADSLTVRRYPAGTAVKPQVNTPSSFHLALNAVGGHQISRGRASWRRTSIVPQWQQGEGDTYDFRLRASKR